MLLFAALTALLALTAWGRAMKPVWLFLLFGAAVCLHLDAVAGEQMLARWAEGASTLRGAEDAAVAS